MPNKNSTLKLQPNNTLTLRKSPRLHLLSQQPPLDPKTPEPASRSRQSVPIFSPLSSLDKGFVENVSKNVENSKCGLSNLGKLSNGLVRSGSESSGFGIRRSPRLSGEANVIDGFLEKESFDEKKRSNVGGVKLGLDSGKQVEGKRGTQGSIREKADEILIKEKFCEKGSERAVVGLDSGKQAEVEKRVTRGSIRGNADEILIKKNFCEKGLLDVERAAVGLDSGKQAEGKKKVTRNLIRGNADENSIKNNSFEKGLSDVERAVVGLDSGKQAEGKKKVTRGSVRENADELLNKENFSEKGFERAVVGLDSGKQAEGKKRVTKSSNGVNADEILIKEKICEKGLSDVERAVVGFDSGKQADGLSVTAKRVTRSSFRGNADVIAEKGNEFEMGLSDVEGPKKGFDLGNKQGASGIEVEKRVTRGSTRGDAEEVNEKILLEARSGDIDRVDERGVDFVKGKQTIGVKRKRNREGEGSGWTQDQELALQRAYFAAKPTPSFWKRVAKLVPGKSAQDCFNKINTDHLTPPQLRTRSRATNQNISSFSLSASKLLKPEDLMIGKVTRRKQNGRQAQKTVRHILQKHYNVDQSYEADLFSVLESAFSPSTKSLETGASYSTPQREKDSNGLLKIFHDKSSSGLKKRLSRLSGSKETSLVSPPVLKPVKNKALHEKYIDQLHCRDAKRRVASRKQISKNNLTQKSEPIKLLKDALVLDANDFIHRFQQRNDSAKSGCSDDDDDENVGREEDDEED